MSKTKDDLSNLRKTCQTQGRFVKNQGRLVKLKEDLSNTKEDLSKTKEDLSNTKEDLSKTKEDLSRSQSYHSYYYYYNFFAEKYHTQLEFHRKIPYPISYRYRALYMNAQNMSTDPLYLPENEQ